MSRTVLITGASSGIGLAAALEFARHGWAIGLVGRGRPALEAAQASVLEAGGAAHIAQADVTHEATLRAAAVAIESALGPIEVWVNNAGIGFYGAFPEVPEDAFRRVIDVNLFGTVHGTRIALSLMQPRRRGTIVQVLSAISYRGVPLQSAYSTSKYALRGFTEAVRAELFHDGSPIHLTMVHPPAVNTPFYSHAGSILEKSPRPPPPVYQPEILGEAIYLAATQKRRDWRVTGSTIAFRLANALAPALLDRLAGVIGTVAQQTTAPAVTSARDPSTFAASTRPTGTHGPFDPESLSSSALWAFTKAPAPLRFGVGMLALVALGGALRRRA